MSLIPSCIRAVLVDTRVDCPQLGINQLVEFFLFVCFDSAVTSGVGYAG